MDKPITRRRIVALAAAIPAAAQQPNTRPPIPTTPDDERRSVLAQFRSNADSIAKVALPMSTEPATHFKA